MPSTEDQEKSDSRLLHRFKKIITRYERDAEEWRNTCEKIRKIFSADGKKKPVYNILWSNVQTQKATTFSKLPKIVAERRFKDKDPLGRLASISLERSCEFSLSAEENSFFYAISASVEDRLLDGIGLAWVRYEPTFEELVDEATQNVITDENGEPVEKVSYEEVITDYLHPDDHGWNSNARTYEEIRQRWKIVRLSRKKLIQQFGEEIGKEVPLDDEDAETLVKKERETSNVEPRATIYELWDFETKKVYWLSMSYDGFLRKIDDPLGLKGFFPSPRPMLGTTDGKSLFPTPDYAIYDELAAELDECNRRLRGLTSMTRLVGVHSGEINESLDKLRTAPDGFTMPIAAWQSFQQGNGFQGMIQWLPIGEVVNSIQVLEGRCQAILQKIYDITGMSDIVRGSSNPYETANAQKIKSEWASKRIQDKQKDCQRFIRDILDIKAQIIANKFSPETIALMCGFESLEDPDKANFPQAIELLKNDALRTFRISIETDSTLAEESDDEKQARLEAVNSIANLSQQFFQLLSMDQSFKPLFLRTLQFGLRSFRSARELEGEVNKAIDAYEQAQQQAAQNPPPPPPPDPNQQEIEAKIQLIQAQIQALQMKTQAEIQMLNAKTQAEVNNKQYKTQADLQNKQVKVQGAMQIEAQKAEAEVANKSQVEARVEQLEQAVQALVTALTGSQAAVQINP